jgi:CubicO group peptidase (beta-lactamase class C family)
MTDLPDVQASRWCRLAELLASSSPRLQSLAVVLDGAVLHEEYRHGDSPVRLSHCWSITKTFVSALVGVAVRHRLIEGPDQALADFFPEFADGLSGTPKEKWTLRHFLTMTSGLPRPEEIGCPVGLMLGPGIANLIGKSLHARPGERFSYGLDYCVLWEVIQRVTGRPVPHFAVEHLFDPLGITTFTWESPDELPRTAALYGLHVTSRDMARLGLLYLNGGAWEGCRVLDESWVRASLSPQADVGDARTPMQYGMGWWLPGDLGEPVFMAIGNGGQRIVLVPGSNAVAVWRGVADEGEQRALQALLEALAD